MGVLKLVSPTSLSLFLSSTVISVPSLSCRKNVHGYKQNFCSPSFFKFSTLLDNLACGERSVSHLFEKFDAQAHILNICIPTKHSKWAEMWADTVLPYPLLYRGKYLILFYARLIKTRVWVEQWIHDHEEEKYMKKVHFRERKDKADLFTFFKICESKASFLSVKVPVHFPEHIFPKSVFSKIIVPWITFSQT